MYAKAVWILISLMVFLAPASAQDAKKPITIDDIMALQSVGDPQISPDGQWVAYSVRTRDMEEDKSGTRIWMVPAAGGGAIAMTAKDSSASDARWSPDNKYLSFLAKRGEKAKNQVWNLNRLGGEAIQVTSVKQGVSGYEWSPDGTRLLLVLQDPKAADLTEDEKDDERPLPNVIDRIQFKMDYTGYLDRRRSHIYVYTPGEEEPVQITSGDYDDQDPVWSPDGTSIAFVSDRSENPDINYGEDIWTVEVDSADHELTQETHSPGRDFSPAWSRDGKRIAYVSSTGMDVGGSALSPTRYLAITDRGRDQRTILTADIDRNVSSPRFSADGKSILFLLQDSGTVHLVSVGATGGKIKRLVGGEVAVRDYAAVGDRVVSLVSRSDQPFELFTLDGGALTDVNGETLSGIAKAQVGKIAFKSADGTDVEAFLVKPLNFDADRNYPTILWLHGGPAAQFTYGFSETAQLFAAQGYAVIMPNPRGSVGYGEAFAKGTVANWGNQDFQDVMAAVDHAIELGIADPDRLGVGGWSYGGILTNHVITQTTRFKAAASGASLGLTTAMYGHDQYQLMYELEFGLPWENPELWTRMSPFYKVANITTPTLWMGGAVDWNVPIINSEQMYLAMKRLGRETQLVVYPGEHHGIRRPSFQKDRLERWVAWFGKYLKSMDSASAR